MLLPLFGAIRHSAEVPVHCALSISAVLVALSAVALHATARRLAIARPAALTATATYALHPVVSLMSVNGVETGTNLALFVVALWRFVVAWQEPSTRNNGILAASLGLLVLSRTDYVFTAAAFVIVLGARDRSAARLAALLLPPALMVAPWLLWNTIVFGSPLQGSAGAVPWVAHELLVGRDASTGETLMEALRQLRSGIVDFVPNAYFTPTDFARPFVLGALVVTPALLAWRSYQSTDRSRMRALGIIAVPLVGLAAQFIVHAGLRWTVQRWYFVPLLPLFALLVGMLVDMSMSCRAPVIALGALALVLVATIAPLAVDGYGAGWYPWQKDMLSGARWIDTNTPQSARVGAINSGIVGYFDNRTTVNLDGVMTPDAAEAIRHRTLAGYIEEERLDLIAEFPLYRAVVYVPFLGQALETDELAEFAENLSGQGPYTIYRLIGRRATRVPGHCVYLADANVSGDSTVNFSDHRWLGARYGDWRRGCARS